MFELGQTVDRIDGTEGKIVGGGNSYDNGVRMWRVDFGGEVKWYAENELYPVRKS